jgi:hypothetical protein
MSHYSPLDHDATNDNFPESRKRVITPLYTLEIRPSIIRRQNWFALSASTSKTSKASNRIWNVYNTSSEGTKKPKYYIDLAASYHLPIWPASSQQTVSIFAGDTEIDDVLARKATPLEVITQTHSLFGRHMCTVSSIVLRAEPEGQAGPDVPTSWLGNGLGHGTWKAVEVEKALQLKSNRKYKWSKQKGAKWKAIGDDWERIEWEGRGIVKNGALELHGDKKTLAFYKPRSGQWVDVDDGKMEGKGGGETGVGIEVGALAVCDERVDDDMARHILLSAVAIEAQIMWSKEFDSGKYHGGWV